MQYYAVNINNENNSLYVTNQLNICYFSFYSLFRLSLVLVMNLFQSCVLYTRVYCTYSCPGWAQQISFVEDVWGCEA